MKVEFVFYIRLRDSKGNGEKMVWYIKTYKWEKTFLYFWEMWISQMVMQFMQNKSQMQYKCEIECRE